MKNNILNFNAIQKLTILSTLAILCGCGSLESRFNPVGNGPWLSVVNQKLPAYDLAKEISIANQKLTFRQNIKDSSSGNLNDSREMLYSSENKKAHLLIMDEMVATTDQAIALMMYQAELRGDHNPKIIHYEAAKYTVGVDRKLNWGYIVMSTYDAASKFSRISVYLFDPTEENYKRMDNIGGENIIKELLFLGKS